MKSLGHLAVLVFFIVMVGLLIRLHIIHGMDVFTDSTTQKAWFHYDPDANLSFTKPWKGSVWGARCIIALPLA